MSEHEHLDHHEETPPIEANNAIVPNAETGEIDIEALKREWSAEWERLLQADIRSLSDYNPRRKGYYAGWKKSLRPYLNYHIVQIRHCGQDSNRINDILRGLRYDREFLTDNKPTAWQMGATRLYPLIDLIENEKDRKKAMELLSYAIDFMKQYTDHILSLPKPALGSEEELLRPAKGAGEVDEAGLVQPVYPENKPTDGAK